MVSGDLPAEWEVLSHGERAREAIEVGRRSRSDAEAARLLRDWGAGGFTQRLLATFACHGSRDPAALLTRAADPSRTIARVALSVLCDVGDDDSLLAALGDLPPRRVAGVLFRLRRSRPGVVDRFVAGRAAEGDGTAWPLVPHASPPVLDRYLPTPPSAAGTSSGGDSRRCTQPVPRPRSEPGSTRPRAPMASSSMPRKPCSPSWTTATRTPR